MNRRLSTLKLAAAAALLVPAVTLGACDKGKKTGSAAAGDTLSYLPATTTMVVRADVDKIRSSQIFASFKDKLMGQLPPEMAEFEQTCGIKPTEDISAVTLGLGSGLQNNDDMVVVVTGKFDKAKANTCFTEMTKKDGREASITEEGKLTIYGDGTESQAVYWVSDNTFAYSASKDSLQAVVDGKNLKTNTEVMPMIEKADQSAAVWAAGKLPADVASNFGALGGAPPTGMYLAVHTTDKLDAKVGINFEKDDQAAQMMMMATMGLGQAAGQPGPIGEMVKNIKIDQEGSALVVNTSMTAEQINAMTQLAGGM